jgi:hypothetical protein
MQRLITLRVASVPLLSDLCGYMVMWLPVLHRCAICSVFHLLPVLICCAMCILIKSATGVAPLFDLPA